MSMAHTSLSPSWLTPSFSSGLPLVLAVTLASSPARAQCAMPEIAQGNFICSPEETSGAYTAITSGDLNGNFSPEVAVIRGGWLIVYQDPDSENVAVTVADDALDVCYSPAAKGPGSPGLLYVSPSGLHRVEYNHAETRYDVETIDEDPRWQAATRVRWTPEGVEPLAGAGLIAFAPALDSFFCATQVGTSFSSATDLFDFTLTMMDFVLLDWDDAADGHLELGILHQAGLQIRDQNGAVLLSRAAVVPGDSIATVRRTGYKDSLAWVTRAPSGMSNLLLFNLDFPGFHFQGPTALGPVLYHSIAAADLRAPDGAEDLVLASSTLPTLQFHLLDTMAAAWFSGPDGWVDVDPSPLGTSFPSGPILCANLFNDWTHDNRPIPGFAAALNGPDGLRVMPDPETAPPSLAGDYNEVKYWSALGVDGNCLINPETDRSKWEIFLGGGWGSTTATELEMIVRKCPEGLDYVDAGVFAHVVVPLSGSGQIYGASVLFFGDETHAVEEDNGVKYFAKIRPRKVGQVWRWSILGMSANCDGMAWLEDRPGAFDEGVDIVEYASCFYEPNCLSAGGGSRYIPTAVPQTFIPSSPGILPGEPPQ